MQLARSADGMAMALAVSSRKNVAIASLVGLSLGQGVMVSRGKSSIMMDDGRAEVCDTRKGALLVRSSISRHVGENLLQIGTLPISLTTG
jgi:hypothetical protein